MKTEFTFKIKQHIGTVSNAGTMAIELNLVSYGGAAPKYDLRRWRTVDGEKKMQKGITMSTDELRSLRDLLNGMVEE